MGKLFIGLSSGLGIAFLIGKWSGGSNPAFHVGGNGISYILVGAVVAGLFAYHKSK